jgi:hypothetical protein
MQIVDGLFPRGYNVEMKGMLEEAQELAKSPPTW